MKRTHEFNLTGSARKPLIEAIEGFTKVKAVYQGAPKFGYAFYDIGLLDKNGALHLDCDAQVIMDLITWLEGCGFACCGEPTAEIEEAPAFEDLELTEREELGLGRERSEDWQGENGMRPSDVPEPEYRTYQAELSDPDCPDRMEVFSAADDEDAIRQAYEYCEGEVVLLELLELDDDYNVSRGVDLTPESARLVIEMPLAGFTPEKLDNLAKLVNAKAPLLKAALGTDDLPIQQAANSLKFPWFADGLDADTVKAYASLVGMICASAKAKHRVTAHEKDPENKKYAMRCWLLSLGFIGEEYRVSRKILLSKLEGSSSYAKPHIMESKCE